MEKSKEPKKAKKVEKAKEATLLDQERAARRKELPCDEPACEGCAREKKIRCIFAQAECVAEKWLDHEGLQATVGEVAVVYAHMLAFLSHETGVPQGLLLALLSEEIAEQYGPDETEASAPTAIQELARSLRAAGASVTLVAVPAKPPKIKAAGDA